MSPRPPRLASPVARAARSIAVLALAACGGQATVALPSGSAGSTASADSARPAAAAPIYFEFQVESPVRSAQGGCAPAYPDSLREAGTTGEVVGQFVVDAKGRVEVATFKAIRSSHAAFTAAVREALPCMRFTAARIRGGAVRQLVQIPFEFRVPR